MYSTRLRPLMLLTVVTLMAGFALAALHIFSGTVWAIFHILIITLQAFVFMMLTLVYIGQAHDSH